MGMSFSNLGNSLVLRSCTLWKTDSCPACRAVMMCLDAMHLSIKEHDVNMENSEHSRIIKHINPVGTLPVFKNQSLTLSDGNAIASYLAYRNIRNRSSDGKNLLPVDPEARARMIHQVYYNSGVLYPLFKEVTKPLKYKNNICLSLQQVDRIESSYKDIEEMLANNPYLGGSLPSLGDILLCAYISTLDLIVRVDRYRWPQLNDWLCRMSGESFYKTANRKGLNDFASIIGRNTINTSKGDQRAQVRPPVTLSGFRRDEKIGMMGPLGYMNYINTGLTQLKSEVPRWNLAVPGRNSELFCLKKMKRKNF